MKSWCVLFCHIATLVVIVTAQSNNVNEDAELDTLGLIEKYGYEGEAHEVNTSDGYLLTMHRILPRGKNTAGKSPVLLQHGLLCSSSDWVIMGPNFGFAYILADAGYDVWLGNNRGNRYSRKHLTLDPNKKEDKDAFWNYSWHQMGVFDLPAEIDYVLEQTNQESLFYAGHSEGTTQFFVLGAKNPEYNKKVKLMGAFAPIAYMYHAPSLFVHVMSPFVYETQWVADMLGINEFMPSSELLTKVGENLCKDQVITQAICSNILFLIAGYDVEELNSTMLPVILGHTPSGASTRQFLHYGQNVINLDLLLKNHFREYDFVLGNMGVYNQLNPPDYTLNNVDTPVALFYSENDWMAGVKDIEKLWDSTKSKNHLANVVHKENVKTDNGKGYNHLDYLWAIHAPDKVYRVFMDLMEKYQ